MKRTLALLMAVLMIAALLPLSAAAANGEKLIAITYDDGPSQYTAQLLDGGTVDSMHEAKFLIVHLSRLPSSAAVSSAVHSYPARRHHCPPGRAG